MNLLLSNCSRWIYDVINSNTMDYLIAIVPTKCLQFDILDKKRSRERSNLDNDDNYTNLLTLQGLPDTV